ncbi:hypothetical protein OG264_15925 [Streptomyces xanthophaeus]|uniref:hypothetical protein n=1 Tax=Streptomyces xanthophaeus TaxID=67385 RepID=UPI0038701E4D|nr:hypothetical protein OG264_15925 [Streptomyces xanthophaeus]WST62178.1 hypothetical protein OG605_22510 [Streptomyces xanthophaeus]
MTNNTPITSAAAATALVKLLVRAEGDPACAPLLANVVWTISGSQTRITGSYYPYLSGEAPTGAILLEAARALLGGTLDVTTDQYDGQHMWHNLATTVAGVPVSLRAPVLTSSVVPRLLQRIADLERAAGTPSAA